MVGIVVTISPSFSLYRMVVFPAASRPTMRILISFLPKRPLNKLAKTFPMVTNLSRAKGKEARVSKSHMSSLLSVDKNVWITQKGLCGRQYGGIYKKNLIEARLQEPVFV